MGAPMFPQAESDGPSLRSAGQRRAGRLRARGLWLGTDHFPEQWVLADEYGVVLLDRRSFGDSPPESPRVS